MFGLKFCSSPVKQMRQDGTWEGWAKFYEQMPNLAAAESFLGVSLK